MKTKIAHFRASFGAKPFILGAAEAPSSWEGAEVPVAEPSSTDESPLLKLGPM